MNIDLSALRSFVVLARELHFARAAAELHLSPSGLTRAIQSLERSVGTRLLARSPHGVALTPEGAEFLRSARRVVAELEWAGRRLNRHSVASPATFTVGCLAGSLYDALPERIRAARLAHPQLQIKLVEMQEEAITTQVQDGTLDMGFLYFPTPDDEMTCRIVARRAQWVAMDRDHPFTQKRMLRIRDLEGQTMILPDEDLAPRLHRWYRAFLEKDGRRTFQYVGANQIHVALGLCAAGEGLCVIAENLKPVRHADLVYLPLLDAPRTELSALWRSDSPVRQVAQFVARWPA